MKEEKMNDALKCLTCVNLHIHGYGDSDWTWEGNEMTCVKKHFKAEERHYGEHKKHISLCERVALCKDYEKGEPFETSPDSNIINGEKIKSCSNCSDCYYK